MIWHLARQTSYSVTSTHLEPAAFCNIRHAEVLDFVLGWPVPCDRQPFSTTSRNQKDYGSKERKPTALQPAQDQHSLRLPAPQSRTVCPSNSTAVLVPSPEGLLTFADMERAYGVSVRSLGLFHSFAV